MHVALRICSDSFCRYGGVRAFIAARHTAIRHAVHAIQWHRFQLTRRLESCGRGIKINLLGFVLKACSYHIYTCVSVILQPHARAAVGRPDRGCPHAIKLQQPCDAPWAPHGYCLIVDAMWRHQKHEVFDIGNLTHESDTIPRMDTFGSI